MAPTGTEGEDGMTQTETTSLASMALALAVAKKPCGYCSGIGQVPALYDFTCPKCKGARDVYVLPSEVRVRCQQIHTKIIHDNPSPNVGTTAITNGPCAESGCLGYTALDPMLLGRWQVALAEADYMTTLTSQRIDYHAQIEMRRGPGFWESAADTPEPALLQAACKALGLDPGVAYE